MARILYQLPGPLHRVMGDQELDRRRHALQRHAAQGTTVEVRATDQGRASIEGDYDAALNVPGAIRACVEAEEEGFDALIVGCFSDPGLGAVREAVDIPVIGPGASAICLALQLGDKFSIVSPLPRTVKGSTPFVREMGVEARFASQRAMGLTVLDLARQDNAAFDKLKAAAEACIEEDGADVLVLGCMSMAFLGMDRDLGEAVGAPVVSPVVAALKTAETMLACGVTHSRRRYHPPADKPTF
jgi:allantoin racemase